MSGSAAAAATAIDQGAEQARMFQDQGFQSASAKKNRQFQREMSNTQIQRRMEDLKNAGVNPLLAVGVLGGASSPQGSTVSASKFNSSGVARSMVDYKNAETNEEILKLSKKKNPHEIKLIKSQELGNTAKALNDVAGARSETKALDVMAEKMKTEKSTQQLNTAAAQRLKTQKRLEDQQYDVNEVKEGIYLDREGNYGRKTKKAIQAIEYLKNLIRRK